MRSADLLPGGYFSGFAGALIMTPVAHLAPRRFDGAPSGLVTLLPAYWLLVPGAMGLIGLAGLVGPHRQGGMQDLGTTVLTIIAVALGTLIGFALTQAVSAQIESQL